MEYMDAGCFDVIYKKTGPIPEDILGKVAYAVVSGLNYLKTKLKVSGIIKKIYINSI